ncbi:MAG: hypothetical protein ACRDQ5_26775 [Sciscionella sp.]
MSAATTLLAGSSLNAVRRAKDLRCMAADEMVDLLVVGGHRRDDDPAPPGWFTTYLRAWQAGIRRR